MKTQRAKTPKDKPQILSALKKVFGERCWYCGKRGEYITIDHVIPLSKKGTWDIENLVLACPTCNQMKGGKWLESFRQHLRFLANKKTILFYFERHHEMLVPEETPNSRPEEHTDDCENILP